MIYLNFSNVEKLIFYDDNIQKLLPKNMFSYFEQWKMGKSMPFLKQIGKSAMIDFLNNINDEHIFILEKYFDERIIVEKLTYSVCHNIEISIENYDCEKLCEVLGNYNFNTYRNKEKVFITYWR